MPKGTTHMAKRFCRSWRGWGGWASWWERPTMNPVGFIAATKASLSTEPRGPRHGAFLCRLSTRRPAYRRQASAARSHGQKPVG